MCIRDRLGGVPPLSGSWGFLSSAIGSFHACGSAAEEGPEKAGPESVGDGSILRGERGIPQGGEL